MTELLNELFRFVNYEWVREPLGTERSAYLNSLKFRIIEAIDAPHKASEPPQEGDR